jgi:GNAT superfamily N-acetyltransferase
MLDYTLVSAKATYRMPAPRDLPALVRMVQALYREEGMEAEASPETVLATVREFEKDKQRGSLFVFERELELAGYAVLTMSWGSQLGGTVLSVDELYVQPAQRSQGLAADFVGLLGKVAPPDVMAIQVAARRGDRVSSSLYRGLGFQETGRQILRWMRRPGFG